MAHETEPHVPEHVFRQFELEQRQCEAWEKEKDKKMREPQRSAGEHGERDRPPAHKSLFKQVKEAPVQAMNTKRNSPGRQVQVWSGLNTWDFVTRPLWTIDQYPQGERIEECAQRRQNDSDGDYKKGIPKELNVGKATSPVQPFYSNLHGYVSLC